MAGGWKEWYGEPKLKADVEVDSGSYHGKFLLGPRSWWPTEGPRGYKRVVECALGTLDQQERSQRNSRCTEHEEEDGTRDTERGQVWHPSVQTPGMFGGGSRDWDAERQRGCPEWMGGSSVLDTSFLSEGGTSPLHSHLLTYHRGESKGRKRCGFLMVWYGGLWDAPASLFPKETQDGSTYHQTRRRGQESLPLIGLSTYHSVSTASRMQKS